MKIDKMYRMLIETANDAIFIADAETGKIIDFNERACKLLDMSEAEIRGMHQSELHPPEESERYREIFKRYIQKRGAITEPLYVVSRTGKRIPVEISANVFDFEGRKIIQGIFRDITERLNAEEELFIKNRAMESSVSPIGIIDTESKLKYVNDAAIKLWGYNNSNEMIGRPITDFWSGDRIHQTLKNLKEKGYDRGEDIGRKKDGSLINVLFSANVIKDVREKPIAILGSFVDITDRKKKDNELKASEEKYRLLFQGEQDAIFLVDAETQRFVDANDSALRLYGYSREEMFKLCVSDISAEPEKSIAAVKEIATQTDKFIHYHTRLHKKKDGTVFPVEISSGNFILQDKKIVSAMVRDITERKMAEDAIQKLDKIEAVGTLAGGIAHDFNNLLTAILSNLYLIKKLSKSDGKIHKLIESSEKASMKAQSLTQQLLTFSKGGEPIKRLVNISDTINEAVSFSLMGSNVQCETCMIDSLWHVEVDEGQMNQVFNNIIINADQSMPDGGTIIVSCENIYVDAKRSDLLLEKGDYVKVSIKDQGMGMSKEQIPRIFDPYFTTKQMGSGLGLSTAYSIVNRHGGRIDVESSKGNGTTFHIYLPASKEKSVDKKLPKDEPIRGEGKILIMDDDEFVRDSLRQMLESLGYRPECAVDGKEAIEAYRNAMVSGQPFDLVIMDLTISGGAGGKKTIEKLQKVDPNVKAIVSSGYSYDPVMANYRDYGFKAVLLKPYKINEELSVVLNDVMKGPGSS